MTYDQGKTENAWADDTRQFTRLISEINATQEINLNALSDAMDLEVEDIVALFDRAEERWNRTKKEIYDERKK